MIFSNDNKLSLGSKQHTLHEDAFPSYATIQFRDLNTSSRMNTKSNAKSLLQSRASRDSVNDEKTSSSSNGGYITHLGVNSSRATTSASFEFIKSSLMARHKNAFVCPNFSEAGIAPVLLPESVARDFQDRCFTTSRFRKLRHFAPKMADDDRTFIEEYEELVDLEKRKSSRNNYSSQQHYRQKADEELLFQNSNEKTLLTFLPSAVKKPEIQTKNKINLKASANNNSSEQQQKNLLYFYRQSGTNKYDWSMNQNIYARKFNIHCSAPKSWLKLKYSKNNDGYS